MRFIPPKPAASTRTTQPIEVQADLLTVSQVARICSVSPQTVRRMIADGRLHAIRIGRCVRVNTAEVARVTQGTNTHVVKPQCP